jgi:hypothetical protein
MRPLSAIDQAILDLAERQHGVLARQQLLELRVRPETIKRWRRAGRLVALRRGVYALGHRAIRPEGHWLAAVLAVGDDAVLSHRSAARLWQIRPWGGAFVELTVGANRGQKPRKGIRVHRSGELHAWEIDEEDGIPVTSVARTLLDLAAVVPAHHLRRAVERSVQLDLYDHRAVLRTLAAHPGRPGSPALVALLDDLHDNGTASATRSDLEALFLQLCLDHGLPRPQVNHVDQGRELDFRWPSQRVVVETNGFAFHRSRAAFEDDHDKRLRLEAAGWQVISLTWRQVTNRPDEVLQHVRRALAQTDGT